MRKPIRINIYDAKLGIWQDDANDKTLRSDVYGELIRQMRARGWSIRAGRETRTRFPSLSPDQREGAKGTLRCAIQIAGRTVSIEFWSETAPQINQYGRYYDFDKLARMAPMDRRRVELEFRRIITWLEEIAPVKVERKGDRHLTPMQRIEKSYAESWRSDKELGRPVCNYPSNARSADGAQLEHGQRVWFKGAGGRILRGTAYYNINNMWWVASGVGLNNKACFELFAAPPANFRQKHNERERRNRLESELQIAVQRMDFQRTQVLKHIIFGNEQTYMIWSRSNSAYYRSQYAGYCTDTASAGKYTRAEAEAECRRVPHALEMVCPDGSRVRFDRSAA